VPSDRCELLAKPFGSGMRAWDLWPHSKGLFNFCPSVSNAITDEARSRLRQSIGAFRAFATFRPRRFARFDISDGPFRAGRVQSATDHIGMACPMAPRCHCRWGSAISGSPTPIAAGRCSSETRLA
jgi:hypothetical protein